MSTRAHHGVHVTRGDTTTSPHPRPPLPALSAAVREVYAHARASYPNECCGYLWCEDDLPRVVACQNAAQDPANAGARRHGFAFAAPDRVAFAKRLDAAGFAIVYHSHPDVGAFASARDLAAMEALGSAVWHLIVDVRQRQTLGARLFAVSPPPQAQTDQLFARHAMLKPHEVARFTAHGDPASGPWRDPIGSPLPPSAYRT